MSDIQTFYVKVYKPAAVFEYEIEVDPDLIGLDDEENVHDAPSTYALRTAIKKAKAGELAQTDNIDEEFVALVHDEQTMHITTARILKEEPK